MIILKMFLFIHTFQKDHKKQYLRKNLSYQTIYPKFKINITENITKHKKKLTCIFISMLTLGFFCNGPLLA